MTEIPTDLRPLGLVHNHERAEALMRLVQKQHDAGEFGLWAYPSESSPETAIEPLPRGCELNWMGGPPECDDENDPPYYCEVSASPRPKEAQQQHEPNRLIREWENMVFGRQPETARFGLYHRAIGKVWYRVQIRQKDLDPLWKAAARRQRGGQAGGQGRRKEARDDAQGV